MIDYNPRQWRSHFFDLKGSMVREIAYRVGAVGVTAIIVSIWHRYYGSHALSDKGHLIVGPALFLLLVFRTNAANDRYWEGRRLWGGIVNTTRNLRRKASTLLTPEEAAQLLEWSIAWVWATRTHLVDERSLGPTSKLSQEDRDAVLAKPHLPVAIADRMTRVIADARRSGQLGEIQHSMLDADVQALIDHLGGCERIDATPLPFAYAVHLRRALVLYCGTLPFALVPTFGVWTVLVSLVISYILIGIEEIGAEIEGPFGRRHNDLPLDALCTRLEANLRSHGTP